MHVCDRSRTINSRLIVGATKGCQEAGEPCPCKTGREFSRVRATCCTRAHPRLSSARSLVEARASRQLPQCFVGRQSRWAGSGIPRRARVSGTHRLCIARSPETRQEVLSRPFAETRKDVAARRREYSCEAEYPSGIAVISGYPSVNVCVKNRFPSCTFIPQWIRSDC